MGLSLANAVFVDEMTADNTSALEAKVDALHAELLALRQALGVQAPPASAPAATPPAAPATEPPPGAVEPG